MNIKAIIHPAKKGAMGLLGRGSSTSWLQEGDSIKEVMANLKDAIDGWLDVANSRV